MAKVGLENDTLKQPKCPSNWEYSTGQRQLLDIQSGEQMDRVSFSAPRNKETPLQTSVRGFCFTQPSQSCALICDYFIQIKNQSHEMS